MKRAIPEEVVKRLRASVQDVQARQAQAGEKAGRDEDIDADVMDALDQLRARY